VEAVLVLAWFCGTISGALWGAAMEHEEQEIARLFGRMMAFFFSLGFLAIGHRVIEVAIASKGRGKKEVLWQSRPW